MRILLFITAIFLTINADSQKLVKEYYDWAQTKIKREYYIDSYGTLNGSYKAYSEYGGILKQGQCKNDGPIGKWIENYENGKLRYIKTYDVPGTYDFQVKDGKIIAYYEDGKTIKYERNFKDMELDGVWKEYNEKGILIKEGIYINGAFQPTGITKIKYDEEQEILKKLEAEKILKNQQEYLKTISEADITLEEKNYSKALLLYQSASKLKENDQYSKEKIAAINETIAQNSIYLIEYYKREYDSLRADKIYYSNTIPVIKNSGTTPGWDVTKYGKVTKAVYDKSQCNMYYNIDKPWESVNLDRPDITYDDIDSDWLLNCMNSNKAFYTPIQILVTQSFQSYVSALKKEKVKIRETKAEYNYKYNDFSYYYDKEIFLNTLTSAKNTYVKAKSLIKSELIVQGKINEILSLNKSNKKKILFEKFQIVLNDYLSLTNELMSIQSQQDNFSNMISFLDKVISLYSMDTKEIEKELKKAETIDQIKSILK